MAPQKPPVRKRPRYAFEYHRVLGRCGACGCRHDPFHLEAAGRLASNFGGAHIDRAGKAGTRKAESVGISFIGLICLEFERGVFMPKSNQFRHILLCIGSEARASLDLHYMRKFVRKARTIE